MKENTVYLVGAGPGDFGLFTVKSVELVKKADILIYDNLVNRRILDYCSSDCEQIYVGKQSSNHAMKQEDINKLLVKKGKEFKSVVRLKGGDPYIFGRGGEEAIELRENNVNFEVINGISSAYSVPTCAGIPVTQRGVAASVSFITGHEDPTKNKSDINWESLSFATQTLVFLMGVKNLPNIVEQLTKYGRKKTTPVAIIQKGTYPTQKTVVGTLETIIEIANKNNIKPPSIIVVGDVVNYREKVNWFEKRPLFGKSIIVTRAREQASKVVLELEDLGANVIEMPVIKIAQISDYSTLDDEIENIKKYNWIIFTSVNGVIHFFKRLNEIKLDTRHLANSKICAIGTATNDELKKYGLVADLIPKRFISDEIAKQLKEDNEIEEKSFLLPRADIAPDNLPETLRQNGASIVSDIPVYKTIEDDTVNNSEYSEILEKISYDLVTFTSSSTVKNFAKILDKLNIKISDEIKCAAIGPVTEKTAKELGFNVVFTAKEHTISGLVNSTQDFFK